MFLLARCAHLATLTTFLGAPEPLVDLADAHTGADPPPPGKEALPEDDGAGEARDPFELVAGGYVGDGEGGVGEGQQDGAGTKGCSATVCAPRLLAVHNETPYQERDREEEGERRIANVPHRVRQVVELVTGVERRKLHACSYDCEGAE